MKVSIVFPVHNGLRYTKMCLKSLFGFIDNIGKDKAEFYVVVVDDGSTDGTYEWISKNYIRVKLLRGDGNLWWSGGINLAVDFAINEMKTDYIVWWNNDILPDKDYFKNLLNILENNRPDTIVGSKIYLSKDQDIVWSMGGIFNPITGFKDMIGTRQPDSDQLQNPVQCDWLTGMGTITHSSVYQEIGMVDEKNFPQYHGDSDFTFRAKKHGFNLIVNPRLKIYNDTDNSGLIHNDNTSNFFRSLFTIRSSYNIAKEFKFYRMHAETIRAYIPFLGKYGKYIGGFIKWKLLGIIGKKRQ